METQSIAKNLVYQRKLKGFSQEVLSEKTQVTVRTIQRIEKGDVNPHLQTVKLLATALDIEVDDLMILENPKEENIQTKWLLLLHGTPVLGLILPLCNILFPLFLWIHKREDNILYDTHGKKIINFQISITLLYVLSFIALVTIEGWGFLFFITVIPFSIMVTFINIFKAINTQKCYYPLAIPFLKTKALVKMIVVLLGSFTLLTPTKMMAQTIKRLDGSTITTDSLTNKINQLVNDANIQGIAITVFNDNQIVYEKHFGYKDFEKKLSFTKSTNIYGASFSKAVFGVLVMKLVEQGVIDLDTPLETYLPKKIHEYKPLMRWHDNYSALKNDSLYSKITARMCLSHTTGFPNYRWFESDQQLRVKREPGTRFDYSGEGLIYLQVILEKITGKNLEELAQELVFKPLQMNRSSYKWQHDFDADFAYGHKSIGEKYEKDIDNEPRGAGTLETTASDFSQFLKAVLDHKILTEKSWNELFKNHISIKSKRQIGALSLEDGTQNDGIQLGYGLGWGILQTPFGFGTFKEGHGDGFQHYFILFPKAKKGIMIMTNSDNGEGIFKELLDLVIKDIYTPYEWQNYIPFNKN